MEKEQLRNIVKKSVESVWYNRRSMNPVEEQTELLTEALHQALSMPGVIASLPEYKLEFCEKCYQMTNHLDRICQKCKGNER